MNGMEKNPDRIAEQAAEHFARRRGASLPQRRARDAWLNEDARHAKAYDELQRLWDRTNSLANDPDLQALKAADFSAMRRPRWFRSQRFLAMAATLVMLIGTGYLVTQLTKPPPVGYATALGERRTETMSDGSKIVLNTDSALEVRYSRGRRAIALKQGEAQFEVAHEASRPFVVSIGEDTVTALGTTFQVRQDLDSTTVTLLKGSVEVSSGNKRLILRPNQQAVLSPRTGIAIASIDPDQATSWLEGWLRFRGARLTDVIAEANRYSEQKLRLGDPRLANEELSGNFHTGDNASIADATSLILSVRVERQGSEIILLPQ